MIFVTVGTTEFDDLVQRMDELAPTLDDEVTCQIGNGCYLPRNCEYFRYSASIQDYLDAASVVVSHGGLGTLMEVIRLNKPLVGISNPDRRDLHQNDILSTLEGGNHLIWCRRLDDLLPSLVEARQARFDPYVEPACTLHLRIGAFLHDEVSRPRPFKWASGVLGRRARQ